MVRAEEEMMDQYERARVQTVKRVIVLRRSIEPASFDLAWSWLVEIQRATPLILLQA